MDLCGTPNLNCFFPLMYIPIRQHMSDFQGRIPECRKLFLIKYSLSNKTSLIHTVKGFACIQTVQQSIVSTPSIPKVTELLKKVLLMPSVVILYPSITWYFTDSG
ncbi:hypothetical protein HHI36_004379 [Cryptolaemus montrouzieri]|uniref:Uncharacterized protein n=1 Tax=Cryptolaemus montrouzieri TaxID=559131 RepID=A0ABD2NR17_9CUCU